MILQLVRVKNLSPLDIIFMQMKVTCSISLDAFCECLKFKSTQQQRREKWIICSRALLFITISLHPAKGSCWCALNNWGSLGSTLQLSCRTRRSAAEQHHSGDVNRFFFLRSPTCAWFQDTLRPVFTGLFYFLSKIHCLKDANYAKLTLNSTK